MATCDEGGAFQYDCGLTAAVMVTHMRLRASQCRLERCLNDADQIGCIGQVAYNALSAGVKTQLPLPPMSPDSALPASSEPAAIPANRPFDPAQVVRPACQHPRHACVQVLMVSDGTGPAKFPAGERGML